MDNRKLQDFLYNLFEERLKTLGFQLVEIKYLVENKRKILRFYVDYPNKKINLDGCKQISAIISKELDAIRELPDNYDLEVSSPGLDRLIITDKDYMRNLNRLVEVKLYQKLDGKKVYEGFLIDFNESCVYLKNNDVTVEIQRSNIAQNKQKIIF